MNPKLFVCAAAAVALCGCASHSTVDWNNGPYAEYGFTYDFVLSPVGALGTEDARAVLALPSANTPAAAARRAGGPTYYQAMAPAPAVAQTAAAPPNPPPTNAPAPALSEAAPPPTNAPAPPPSEAAPQK